MYIYMYVWVILSEYSQKKLKKNLHAEDLSCDAKLLHGVQEAGHDVTCGGS